MVYTIPTFDLGAALGQGAGQGINQGVDALLQRQGQEQKSNRIQQALASLSPEQQQDPFAIYQALTRDPEIAKDLSHAINEKQKLTGKEVHQQQILDFLFKRTGDLGDSQDESILGTQSSPLQRQQHPELSQQELAALSLIDPQTANLIQKSQKEQHREFESERSYHSGFTKDIEKEYENLRIVIPAKENAIDLAKEAVASGNVGQFSKDAIANVLPSPFSEALRTAKGAQLITAGKENLLNNMSRVSAKAQNVWFEKRLNDMFPQIGQSQEANKTVSEMLDGELSMEKARLNLFDKLAQEDENKFGYVRKDIGRRVAQEVEPLNQKIFERTSYRLRELEEQEKGIQQLRKNVGKKVSKGTPMTMGMMKLYLEKFGDKSLERAKKDGYSIPTLKEFDLYRSEAREFRDKLIS